MVPVLLPLSFFFVSSVTGFAPPGGPSCPQPACFVIAPAKTKPQRKHCMASHIADFSAKNAISAKEYKRLPGQSFLRQEVALEVRQLYHAGLSGFPPQNDEVLHHFFHCAGFAPLQFLSGSHPIQEDIHQSPNPFFLLHDPPSLRFGIFPFRLAQNAWPRVSGVSHAFFCAGYGREERSVRNPGSIRLFGGHIGGQIALPTRSQV